MPFGQAVLTIDLGAIVANWRALRERHGGPVAAVLKADAYGLGAGRVGQALAAAGCDAFFVAQRAEGLALRAAVGSAPLIAVLDGFAPGADGLAALIPVLNRLEDCAAHAGRPAILHLDTGMARLGLSPAEQDRLAADATMRAGLRLTYVMTHLACADTPDHPLNGLQAARFDAAAARLAPGVPRSLANSSGIFLGAAFRSDLARPGAALFGLNPTPGAANPMRPVVRLRAPILQVRDLPAGGTVGYGADWTAPRASRIATVAAGYADGYLRAAAGRATATLAGRTVALVGRVSMDLLTFDVTDTAAQPGDWMELIGPDHPPDTLAAAAGTIGYEVLVRLGSRYRRDYTPA